MSSASFNVRLFQDSLVTESLGRYLVYRPVTESTMILARREVEEGAASGTLILAEEQTAGRGRRGRSFHSPPGENLYFTFILRIGAEEQRRVPQAVAVAVAESCRAEGADTRIKWPNDVWIGERKVSGMLIDAESHGDEMVVMPGVGINVNGDPTTIAEIRDIATSLRLELGRELRRELLLARICNNLETLLDPYRGELGPRYSSLSMILGRQVAVTGPEGTFEGRALDLAADGGLVVERTGGAVATVYAADVSVRPL